MFSTKVISVLLSTLVPSIHALPKMTNSELGTESRKYCNDPDNYDPSTYGTIENWDVSEVTGMNQIMKWCRNNPDISAWNVGKVTSFWYFAEDNPTFNSDVSGWDVSSAVSMNGIFRGATSFNQDISDWDVAKVTDFTAMLTLTSFDHNISGWNVSSGTVFHGIFQDTSAFNQDISTWDTSNANDFSIMFYGASSFDQNISGWNVSSGTNFNSMFRGATSFHQDLRTWPQSARDADRFCENAICDKPSTSSPTKTSSPTTNPTNSPTSNPTTSPTGTLPAKYVLNSPVCNIDVTDGTTAGDVTCVFSDIDSPNDAVVSMEIRAHDCISSYDATQFGNTAVTAGTNQAEGVTSFNAVANVDPASGHEGNVEFCVRTDLKDADNGETMSYRSEQIQVTFSYNGSFAVSGFASTPFVGIGDEATVATKNFGVTATVCDSAGTKIENPPALSLGTNLFVCIEADVVGTKIPSITSFTATKDTESDYNVNAPSPNVVIRGLGSSAVKVVMNLPARFFANDSNIILSGSVDVTRDDGSRRRRHLEISIADTAEFTMEVKVKNDTDSSSTSERVMLMSTVIFGVTMFLM